MKIVTIKSERQARTTQMNVRELGERERERGKKINTETKNTR